MQLPHRALLRRRIPADTKTKHRNDRMTEAPPIDCRARFDPLSSVEDRDDRESSRTVYNVLLAPVGDDAGKTAADLAGYDVVTWVEEGLELLLDGDAVPVHDGLGRRHHFEVEAYRDRV